MLYEITFVPDDDDEQYKSVIVESPKASRFGIVKDELISWATDTWATQFCQPGEVHIAVYNPARIGYKSSNDYGVNSIAHTWTLYEIPIGFPHRQLEVVGDEPQLDPEPEPAEHHGEWCEESYNTACQECRDDWRRDQLEAIDAQILRYAM